MLPGAKAQHLLSSAVSSGALLLSSCKKYQSLRGPSIYKNQALGVGPLSHVSTALNSLSLLRSNSGQTRDICKVTDLRIIRIFLFEKFCHKRILAQRVLNIFSLCMCFCLLAVWFLPFEVDYFGSEIKMQNTASPFSKRIGNLKAK